MRSAMIFAGVVMGLSCSVAVMAQEKGRWRPLSTTSLGITGGVAFSNETLSMNFLKFPIAEIRDLTPGELIAIALGDPMGKDAAVSGHLYRLSIPATQRFLNRNTMCGGDETQWMTTAVRGKTLQLAFFSTAQMPVLTAEALANTTNLCGTFSYMR
jgi:hypothetical protein